MSPKRYDPMTMEPRLAQYWAEQEIYYFDKEASRPIYSIDTPPPTVSGNLHLGHIYSYSHTDFIARFWRMSGYNVFYPMGFDDNGLPTERMVERKLNIRANELNRKEFIQKCLQISAQAKADYRALWQRLGLSIDWRYTYSTIDDSSRRTSQISFVDLYHQGLVYRKEAPAIWCPECSTAIAQADVNDLERRTEFVTIKFLLADHRYLPIATTRSELLPACVAVFVHPQDERYQQYIGSEVIVPLFGQRVTVLGDDGVSPDKGSGAVMCCTFGDTVDVGWWQEHRLGLINAIDRQGHLTSVAQEYTGLSILQARQAINQTLNSMDLLLDRWPADQTVRVHERCDTPVEYLMIPQWFVSLLEYKDIFLDAGESIAWHPPQMAARYRGWVENLKWDWCISRQRYYGVPFPLWYCGRCGEVLLAEPSQLPIDPRDQTPGKPCHNCGSEQFIPETDVMDTWATSSLSPQIVGRWLAEPDLYDKVFPFSLRPQAHEIIRNWTFYTIVKSHFQYDCLPWKNIAISGWGIAGEGMGKISKSRGGGPMSPLEMINRYSADSVRYWAASSGPGKDAVISEEKIQQGSRLVTKLWNVAQFSQRFLENFQPPDDLPADLSPADRWILSRLQRLIRRTTDAFLAYDYSTAKSEVEVFFWTEFTDNYIEMAKQRLYAQDAEASSAAIFTLYHVLLTTLKLFAPILPYICEVIYQDLFSGHGSMTKERSIHLGNWPVPHSRLEDDSAELVGKELVFIATVVRRYKSEANLPLGSSLALVHLATEDDKLGSALRNASADLMSITRAQRIEVGEVLPDDLLRLESIGTACVAIQP